MSPNICGVRHHSSLTHIIARFSKITVGIKFWKVLIDKLKKENTLGELNIRCMEHKFGLSVYFSNQTFDFKAVSFPVSRALKPGSYLILWLRQGNWSVMNIIVAVLDRIVVCWPCFVCRILNIVTNSKVQHHSYKLSESNFVCKCVWLKY